MFLKIHFVGSFYKRSGGYSEMTYRFSDLFVFCKVFSEVPNDIESSADLNAQFQRDGK